MKQTVLERAVVASLPAMPRTLVERFARHYVAGPSMDDALGLVAELSAQGRSATIDVLGEGYESPQDCRALVDEYLRILRAPRNEEAPHTLSLMMTGLGLKVDHELCRANLAGVTEEAASAGIALTINMEDSTTTDQTLEAYRDLRRAGHDHVGIVLQAAMRRSLADAEDLADLRPRVRVVKGIWVEPYDVAHEDFEVIRHNYLRLLEALLEQGSYVEIATHDEFLVEQAKHLLAKHGRGPDAYEFQMLLGVRPELGDLLIAEGHPLRVYVPYGEDWYEYCLRRLRESPSVARHAISDGMTRVLHGGQRRRHHSRA